MGRVYVGIGPLYDGYLGVGLAGPGEDPGSAEVPPLLPGGRAAVLRSTVREEVRDHVVQPTRVCER